MALLNIGHILSGYKNTALHMKWMVLQGAVVVKEWRYVQLQCSAFVIYKCCGHTSWLDKALCVKFGSVHSNMVHLLISQGNQDMYCWMMVESSAWSALILQ
jgi:hypothetical protein